MVVGLNLSEKKQKERKVAFVVTDSHDSRSLKTATHHTKKGVHRRHTFYSKPTPRSLTIIVLFYFRQYTSFEMSEFGTFGPKKSKRGQGKGVRLNYGDQGMISMEQSTTIFTKLKI